MKWIKLRRGCRLKDEKSCGFTCPLNPYLLLIIFILLTSIARVFGQEARFGTLTKLKEPLPSYDTIPLQPIIDAAAPGEYIALKAAVYTGLFIFLPMASFSMDRV